MQELASQSEYTVTLWCKLFHYAISPSHRDTLTHHCMWSTSQPNVKSAADTRGTDTLNLHLYCAGGALAHCELCIWSDVSLFIDFCRLRQTLLRNVWLLSHVYSLQSLYDHMYLIMIQLNCVNGSDVLLHCRVERVSWFKLQSDSKHPVSFTRSSQLVKYRRFVSGPEHQNMTR